MSILPKSDLAQSTIRLSEPLVGNNSVHFEWSVDPETSLYSRTSFDLEFPPSVDISQIPAALWARVMMICLHSHWALMRPCRVVLPYRLPEGEIEFWNRLTDAATWALETRRGDEEGSFVERTRRAIEFVETGEPVGDLAPAQNNGTVAACFSGGRDSLTQLALLQELGERPFLVTTTSARADSEEMVAERRRMVIDEIQRRRDVELIEVESDFRDCFDNLNERAGRFGVSVNEVSDTFLYFAAAWAVAYARGARSVFLASEAEVQESIRRDGMVIQYTHFMYSGATQSALSGLIGPSAIGYSGLTYPLLQFQIHRLLNTRFVDIRDLQYSCWEQRPGEGACSRCRTCFFGAVNLISDGVAPQEIDIDLNSVLVAQRDWNPQAPPSASETSVPVSVRSYIQGHAVRFFRDLEPASLAQFAGPDGLSADALAAAQQIHATALAAPDPGPEPGYRAGYFELIEDRLRDGLEAIVGEHFEAEPPENYAELLRNSRILGDWIAAPLTGTQPESALANDFDARPQRPRPPAKAEPTSAQLAEIAEAIPGPEPFVDRSGPNRYLPVADTDLSGNELAYVTEAVESNWVSSAGPYVDRLERMFADYCGTKHAITTGSGATALDVMLRAGGIGDGDEVIVPTFTMVATANAVHFTGAKVVFVDSDPATWNMDLDQVRLAIGPKTRAIIAMHTYGHPVDMDALRELADANSLALFEDAAEAHGATCRGRRVGSLSDAAAFSFYGNKIVTTGEGGIITTDDDELAEAARELRSHSFSTDRHFWHRRRAFNYRMSNLQAAVGIAQLERLDEFLEQRRGLARMYREQLKAIPGISLPPLEAGLESANWMFGLVLDDDFPVSRDELRERLGADGIETRTFFVPLHLQPAYLDENEGRRLPVAERLGSRGLYLPSALWLTDDDVARIVSVILQATEIEAPRTSSPNSA